MFSSWMFWTRSIEVKKEIASRLMSHMRPQAITTEQQQGLDVLWHRLGETTRRAVEHERLVADWRLVIEAEHAAGRDTCMARQMLTTMQMNLDAAMTDKEQAESALKNRLLDLW